jgi:hypothetical protein
MLRKKPHIRSHLETARNQLSERIAALAARGMTDTQIQRDSKVKHYKGEMRQARHQLAVIAGIESRNAEKAEIKARKKDAAQTEPPRRKRGVPETAGKKTKKEKKAAAVETAETEE